MGLLPMEPRSAVLGGGGACGRCHRGPRWSSLWSHESPYWVEVTHAGDATRALGGAPSGATKCWTRRG
eukprot:8810281-Pyramimonas_sp.AAC.1